MIIIDGHDVYEIDENCLKNHKVDKTCELQKILKEKEKYNKNVLEEKLIH